MDTETAIRCIGISHLLQPPLTVLLAKHLKLRLAFESLPPVAWRVAQNMAFAAVALPTSLGVFLACNAHDVLRQGPIQNLAIGVALFWTWRLERQLRAVGPLIAHSSPVWHTLLTLVFTLQGPVLGALLLIVCWQGAR
jgi:hypothetical protein